MLTNHTPQDYIQPWSSSSWQPQIFPPQNHQHLYYTYEKEHMFEKPLTPSDVGKLNRLVIPKQYAEKFFPLDPESGERGLILSFEDESGKQWRFRYSYWTSSQSYVLTKGWSRYVKEKRLEAGDVVYFERVGGGGGNGDRMYIMWRKRGSSPANCSGGGNGNNGSYPASPVSSGYNNNPQHPCYFQGDHQARNGEERSSSTNNTVAAQTPSSNSRRLRLFGVNLDCVITEPDSPSESVQEMNGSMFGGAMNNQSSYAPVPNYYWRNC